MATKKSAPNKGKSSARAEITSLKTMRTPIGVAAFSYLTKPDDSFGKERFRINVFFPDFKTNPEFKKFAAAVVELQNTFMKENSRPTSKVPMLMKMTYAQRRIAITSGRIWVTSWRPNTCVT